ncbi:MAG: TonB-dependent receptor [Hyphomicrobium sp.]
MKNKILAAAVAAGTLGAMPAMTPVLAQQAPPATTTPPAATPAVPAAPAGQTQLPPVDIIQKQAPKPAPKQQAAPQPKVTPKAAQPAPQAKAAPKAKAPAPKQAPTPQPEPEVVEAQPTSIDAQRAAGDVVRTTPYGNSEIAIEKVPGSVSTISAATIAESGSNEPQDVLQKNVPGIILSDAGGNDLRAQVEYRGFGAGSLNGFPQGLAVYQNGVRVNEVFGDTVNWDIIPKNAISDLTVLSGNPIFGLNAIGGAVSVVMKDGFQFQGVEIDAMFGSYGRKQIGVQVGQSSGPFAMYFAGEAIDEDGWRDFSPTEVKRAYIDLGFKQGGVEAHFNLTMAKSLAGIVAASPVDLLAVDRARTFTSPQTTDLEVFMPSFNASVKVTDTLTLSGLAYYRRFKSKVIDGNGFGGDICSEVLADATAAAILNGTPAPSYAAGVLDTNICSAELDNNQVVAVESNNVNLDSTVIAEPFGVIDRINTKSESFGFNVQAADKSRIFGHNNHFVVGASYDQGKVDYRTSSEFGTIGDRFVVAGTGLIIEEPDDFAARHVAVDTKYLGVYLLNALDVTDRLTLTFGGRFNYAKIDLEDLSGNFPDITSQHSFQRFNPTVGATFQLVPGITLFGGYSEANRAPTAAELACANPDQPCPIESFLTDDPPLEQVVSKTVEVGLRGKMRSNDGLQRLDWGLAAFRTVNEDDILFVSANVTGRGFFFNAGETQRQGLEASLKYKYGPLSTYASYSYIEATYQTPNEFSSPNNPLAGPCTADPTSNCINVEKGDNIPGIPNHRFKTGFDYFVTPSWKVGADMMVTSGQHFYGDEANLLDKLGGYTRVDLSTSYDLTSNIQIYAFAKNVFDRKYGLFGTLFDPAEAPAEVVSPTFTFNDPRSIVPAAPVSVYGGVKIKF